MTQSILRLQRVSKVFIAGRSKRARRALEAQQELQEEHEKALRKEDQARADRLHETLERAQRLFAADEFDKSYVVCTGKWPHQIRNDRGTVTHALKGVDLTIAAGELVAIMGPSGSGKSTLLNMLGLLDEPTVGQIFIRGKNVTAIPRRELPEIRARELGFVFQAFNLIATLTALENVMLPLRYSGISRKDRRDMARRALEDVGLGGRLGHTPNELSGGQQQRVAIARSIVNHPSVILGDELTGELDSKATAAVMDLVGRLNSAGQTFVLVTHNPDVARRCKRVLIMHDGKIERDITPHKYSPADQPISTTAPPKHLHISHHPTKPMPSVRLPHRRPAIVRRARVIGRRRVKHIP